MESRSFGDTDADGNRESMLTNNDYELNPMRGGETLNNRKHTAALDNKLDNDEIDQELLIRNINEMVKANMPIVQFPESQSIVDRELLKEKHMGIKMENLKGGIAEDLRGTLYNRVAHNPNLF